MTVTAVQQHFPADLFMVANCVSKTISIFIKSVGLKLSLPIHTMLACKLHTFSVQRELFLLVIYSQYLSKHICIPDWKFISLFIAKMSIFVARFLLQPNIYYISPTGSLARSMLGQAPTVARECTSLVPSYLRRWYCWYSITATYRVCYCCVESLGWLIGLYWWLFVEDCGEVSTFS